jgi:OmpA-OmpF porin, OOP family
MKRARIPRGSERNTIGDQWTFVAIDAETKLVPSYLVGKRTRENVITFMRAFCPGVFILGERTPEPVATTVAQNAPQPAPVTPALSDADMASAANAKVTDALTSLKAGFTAKDLVDILNLSIINFPTAGYEVPASEMALLQKAAAQIKRLASGAVLEIAGYTDNTGDAAANQVLSQQRADAVRNALINAGVDPSLLVAKGYGSANPVGSNESNEGRLHNRRIEYHVIKS